MHSLAPPGLTAFSIHVRWFAPPAHLRPAAGVRLREPASTLAKFMTRNSSAGSASAFATPAAIRLGPIPRIDVVVPWRSQFTHRKSQAMARASAWRR